MAPAVRRPQPRRRRARPWLEVAAPRVPAARLVRVVPRERVAPLVLAARLVPVAPRVRVERLVLAVLRILPTPETLRPPTMATATTMGTTPQLRHRPRWSSIITLRTCGGKLPTRRNCQCARAPRRRTLFCAGSYSKDRPTHHVRN